MSASMVPGKNNLSLATRALRLAESLGFYGEGAISVPIQNSLGTGTSSLVICKEPLENAPPGTVILLAGSRKFQHYTKGDDGKLAWADMEEDGIENALAEMPPSTSIPTKPLPPKPDPNAEDMSIITDPVIGIDGRASEKMLGTDGMLKVGSGNSANHMVTGTNGELSLAIAPRYYRLGADIVPTTESNVAHYAINAAKSDYPEERDWSMVFGIAVENDKNRKGVLEMYDVLVKIVNRANGKHMDFVGEFKDNEFHLYDSRQDVRITDSVTDENGGLCLGIQRVSHYLAKLQPEISGPNSVPIGTFDFSITAKRKRGNVPALVVAYTVEVEDVDTSMIVDAVTTIGQKPSNVALTAQGNLRIGSSNPSTFLVVTNNGELELFGGARYYRRAAGNALPVGTNPPVYEINVANSTFADLKDWTWVYSAALLNTKNSQTISDLYDLKMIVRGPNAELEFYGEWDGLLYHFKNDEHGLDITDNAVDQTGRFAQNIQRVTFYKDQLQPEIGENTGAPIGDYEFELVATRKIGDVPPLSLKFNANVIDYIPPPPPPEPEPEPEPVADEAPSEPSEDEQIQAMLDADAEQSAEDAGDQPAEDSNQPVEDEQKPE